MKTAITFLLEEYADWEGAYITSTLNQKEGWQNKTGHFHWRIKNKNRLLNRTNT